MRALTRLIMGTAFTVALTLPTLASVDVSFVEPENYTDLRQQERGYGAKGREMILNRLRAHLEKLGAKHLSPNQTLSIEVLNVDLAGRYEPFLLGNNDGRIATRVTWPSMKLRYVLSENGEEVLSGEERIADLAYLDHAGMRRSSDNLRYEKAMLDDWFEDRIVERKPQRD